MSKSFVISTTEGTAVSDIILSVRVNDLRIGWQSRSIHDLIMIKGVRGYSWLYWNDGSKQMMAYTIKHYENQLPIDDFIRVHQNCVINRNFVQKTQLTHRGPMLRLATGTEIIISRRRWSMVKKELQHLYWG
ncbi:LytR/AlgR family response regulator transcription factor [Spirosoma radiotolerans]|uniref:LytR/AlgR family response regulator transcription factor n=1 Tax=Spirosoma radiotolerans TaxID=1379870 RepID=UPI0006272FC3|nr:LytTR family DNA-binding domain-containing protein [Spirosoma radiotolerans]